MRNILIFMRNNKKLILKMVAFAAYIVALVFLFILVINLSIVAKTNDNIYTIDEFVKVENDFDCILILGAGVKADGSPTDMLYDRLCVGYKALEEEKSNLILISGDSEYDHYTETVTMDLVLKDMGIYDVQILSDGYGLSTYESLWRAKNVYGFDKVLIVTQKYHLHRAIYIAEKLGMDAYGVDAALRGYGKQPIYSFREYFARIKDIIFSEIKPLPTYTEKWEAENE